jgi:hypothetical protein
MDFLWSNSFSASPLQVYYEVNLLMTCCIVKSGHPKKEIAF